MIAVIATGACGGAPTPAPTTERQVTTRPPTALARVPNGDRDGDGVPNERDQCPLLAEDRDGIDDADGCPETDADGDGVPDVADACPKEPGPTRAEPKQNGCPYVDDFGPRSQITILAVVSFGVSNAKIEGSNVKLIDDVATVLKEHPEIRRVELQGNTSSDEPGAAALSEKRAAAVRDALVAKGVAKDRLVPKGYGSDLPTASNATTEGRIKNRRVGFKILEQVDP